MVDQPLWEHIGSSFVSHYYHMFDNDRSQLGSIYIDASCLTWEGQQFQGKRAIVEKLTVSLSVYLLLCSKVTHNSQVSDCSSMRSSCIFGQQVAPQKQGFSENSDYSLPFTKIAHSITAQDHQPTPDCCILSMVVGQLKADDDPIMGFHQSFILKNINDAWVCTNDMFRLAIHNFG
ncbi:nuclear transport factor 2 [Xyrichtys novacula]|uniref:Nuclear transport factor 2 n=1 Tax=Xyrichtys novacula TaxID=13765 RepID=A0AAV1FA40_XYRNO|nr:nuclear transport factor 2 [Xyrichtys novacula]